MIQNGETQIFTVDRLYKLMLETLSKTKLKHKADSLPAGEKSDGDNLVKIMYKQKENLNGHQGIFKTQDQLVTMTL